MRILQVGGGRSFPAWIDLGFEGELVVPRSQAARLGIELTDRNAGVLLGDGTTGEMRVGQLAIRLFGRTRVARVLLSQDDDPPREETTGEIVALIGLGLLRGARLSIDLVPGGAVNIERPIPTRDA